jgi:hypothetical protein
MIRRRDKMREDLELRGMSASTVTTYVCCARRFVEHFGLPPGKIGATDVRSYLLHLIHEVKAAPSTVNVYAGAIQFLYRVTLKRPEVVADVVRVKEPMRLPRFLSGAEVERLLVALPTLRHQAMAIPTRGRYLFPIEVLSALFRGKLLATLDTAIGRGEVKLPSRGATDPEAWERLRDRLHRIRWNVYAKRPFGGAEQVIRYLGRYTHRVGISNHRLVSMNKCGVTFRTKEGKTRTLSAEAFLARFLSHVLPKGFVKIRHYGLMSASHATTRLETARTLLTASAVPSQAPVASPREDASASVALDPELARDDLRRCPACGELALVRRPLPDARAPPVAA